MCNTWLALDSLLPFLCREEVRMGDENFTSIKYFVLVGLSNDRRTQILLFVVVFIIYSLTIMGNLVIIILVRLDSSLHTPMYFFLTHLSSLEICFVTSTLPQMLAHLLSGNGVISFTHCTLQMYISLSLGGTECLLLSAMAYDRYLAICHPLLYASIMGWGRQVLLTSLCWAGGFLLGSINAGSTIRLPFCGPNRINHFFCELPIVLKLSCADTHLTEAFIFVASVLLLIIPLTIILISYGLVLSSVLQMKSTTGLRKALSTCGSHLIVVTLFYSTVISMYMIPRSGSTSDRDKKIAVFYIVVTPLLNPIIYTLRNKDIHGAAAKVLRRLAISQELRVAY
ncbi:olfactory receptor 2D2-like [Podarcis raffonei]|uniref:olfactory receptor 2D2-like n=1 Tax=Podarcis raffonei TaxID=65483 RepID=UPI00232978F1|nr:olfactory receptor 2D2-like [Podarcis raffonei]